MRRILCKNQTLSQVIMQLFSFLIIPVIEFSGDNLRYYLREVNETCDIDRGQFELVNLYLSLLLVEFMCLVVICFYFKIKITMTNLV